MLRRALLTLPTAVYGRTTHGSDEYKYRLERHELRTYQVRRVTTCRHAQNVYRGHVPHDHEAFTIGHERAADDTLRRPHATRQSPTCPGCPDTPAEPINRHPDCLSSCPHAHLAARRSTCLEEVESTRPPRPGSRRNSLGKPAPISSIHMLHGQPTRPSGELECERDYTWISRGVCTGLAARGAVHKQCKGAKHTWRVSVWWCGVEP